MTISGNGFVFNGYNNYMWATIGSLTVFFAAVFFYLFNLRNMLAFKARSPILIFIGVLLIYLDTIGSTFEYSVNASDINWNNICNINIFV